MLIGFRSLINLSRSTPRKNTWNTNLEHESRIKCEATGGCVSSCHHCEAIISSSKLQKAFCFCLVHRIPLSLDHLIFHSHLTFADVPEQGCLGKKKICRVCFGFISCVCENASRCMSPVQSWEKGQIMPCLSSSHPAWTFLHIHGAKFKVCHYEFWVEYFWKFVLM